jgi:hypothetical protein
MYREGWLMNPYRALSSVIPSCEVSWNALAREGALPAVRFLVMHNCPVLERKGWRYPETADQPSHYAVPVPPYGGNRVPDGSPPSQALPNETYFSEQQSGACGYYINSSGHQVPRPCGNWHTARGAAGATALCADGTYSYSEPLRIRNLFPSRWCRPTSAVSNHRGQQAPRTAHHGAFPDP